MSYACRHISQTATGMLPSAAIATAAAIAPILDQTVGGGYARNAGAVGKRHDAKRHLRRPQGKGREQPGCRRSVSRSLALGNWVPGTVADRVRNAIQFLEHHAGLGVPLGAV